NAKPIYSFTDIYRHNLNPYEVQSPPLLRRFRSKSHCFSTGIATKLRAATYVTDLV
ncbi:unnamed protein product, partial [marine sediment metagenome]